MIKSIQAFSTTNIWCYIVWWVLAEVIFICKFENNALVKITVKIASVWERGRNKEKDQSIHSILVEVPEKQKRNKIGDSRNVIILN